MEVWGIFLFVKKCFDTRKEIFTIEAKEDLADYENEMKDEKTTNTGEIMLYQDQDGKTTVEVKFKNDTARLNAHQMSDLFGIDRTSIVRHVHNIYKTQELSKD